MTTKELPIEVQSDFNTTKKRTFLATVDDLKHQFLSTKNSLPHSRAARRYFEFAARSPEFKIFTEIDATGSGTYSFKFQYAGKTVVYQYSLLNVDDLNL
jgi:hypothetical protein